MRLSRNEIITLKHLSDGKNHELPPSGLSDAQFKVSLKTLKEKCLVNANFLTGDDIAYSKIRTEGKAALDDMNTAEKRIIRRLVAEKDITTDQFELLRYARDNDKCENIFGIDCNDYEERIWKELYQKKFIQNGYENNQEVLILTRLGRQLVEDIEDGLFSMLSDDCPEEEKITLQFEKEKVESQDIRKVKDSGIRINEDRITDLIKIVWSMHKIGLFVDEKGKKPALKSIMDAFAEFLDTKQIKQYSAYMNKALQSKYNTYLDVFYQMGEKAKEHYISKNSRKIVK